MFTRKMLCLLGVGLVLGCGAAEDASTEGLEPATPAVTGWGNGGAGVGGLPVGGAGEVPVDSDAGVASDALTGEEEDAGAGSFSGYTSFASEELGISILNPGPAASAATEKSTVSLSGLAFGPVESILITCDCGEEVTEVPVTPAAFWESPDHTFARRQSYHSDGHGSGWSDCHGRSARLTHSIFPIRGPARSASSLHVGERANDSLFFHPCIGCGIEYRRPIDHDTHPDRQSREPAC